MSGDSQASMSHDATGDSGVPASSSDEDRLDHAWESMLHHLALYHRKHGHCFVPLRCPENRELGAWLHEQIQHYRKGRLSAAKQHSLEGLGLEWDFGESKAKHPWREGRWEERFAELAAFQQQHGHLHVTKSNQSSAGLMHWRDNQRINLRAGTLTPERRARLDAIGFEWENSSRLSVHGDEHREVVWNRMFVELQAYKLSHGHCEVPSSCQEHPTLAKWVQHQRTNYKDGRIPPERQQRLEEIGFAWKSTKILSTQGWEVRYAELVAFQQQHGHLRVTLKNQSSPGLMHWRDNQRINLSSGTLTPERRAKLDAIGFEWEGPGRTALQMAEHNTALWERSFAALLDFKAAHGHTQVPTRWKQNPALASWVQRQRNLHRQGSLLPVERQQRLEDIGFSWQPDKLQIIQGWEGRYAELVAFQQQHGHLHVTKSNQTSAGLMHWRDNQRLRLNSGTMKPEQKARLDAIGFEWQPPGYTSTPLLLSNNILWEQVLERLVAFKERHGHCEVPATWPEDQALANWVRRQRKRYRHAEKPIKEQAPLSPEQIARLEALGFEWQPPTRITVRPSPRPARPRDSISIWERGFVRLTEFHRLHGHVDVPSRPKSPLRAWVVQQRRDREIGRLHFDQITRLDALRFAWQAPQAARPTSTAPKATEITWSQRFAELQAFIATHGHSTVPKRNPDYKQLYNWVVSQRVNQKRGSLQPQHKEQLDAIGFQWRPSVAHLHLTGHASIWDSRFAELQAFIATHGHTRIPKNKAEFQTLRGWVVSQRVYHRKGSLNPKYKQQLDAIGFEWKPNPANS